MSVRELSRPEGTHQTEVEGLFGGLFSDCLFDTMARLYILARQVSGFRISCQQLGKRGRWRCALLRVSKLPHQNALCKIVGRKKATCFVGTHEKLSTSFQAGLGGKQDTRSVHL